MNFCETCALADSKQKISQKPQHQFKKCDKYLHINIGSDSDTFEDSDLSSSFQKCRYFVLIIDDAIQYH